MNRMTSKNLALVLMGSLAFGGVALAGPGMGKGDGQGKAPAAMKEKFDKNKDGKLDESERKAMHDARFAKREEMLKRFDTNKDGVLEGAERTQMRDAVAAERFKALDKDGNGVLSLQEFQAGAGKGGKFRHGR